MAGTKQATLVLRPGAAQIVIDGVNIANSVGAIDLHADARSVPQLKLDLALLDLLVNGEMQVTVPAHVAEALIVLGWTPPEV